MSRAGKFDSYERQIHNAIEHVAGIVNLGQDLQVFDALAISDVQLMRINDSEEIQPGTLPPRRLAQEISILAKQHTLCSHGPVEQLRVREPICSVLLCCKHADSTLAQCPRHRAAHLHVHIKIEAQLRLLRARS